MVLHSLRSKLLLVAICFVYSLAQDGGKTEDIVRMPPSIINGPDSAHGTHLAFDGKPGEVITLPCLASGEPKPSITWERDGKRVEASDEFSIRDDGKLVMKDLTRKDAAKYQCFAVNSYGKSLSKSVELEYSFLDIEQSNEAVLHDANQGQQLKVDCRNAVVTPQNQAQYEWYVAKSAADTGIKVEPDERISLDFKGNLLFAYTKLSDAKGGQIYKCSVRNKELDSTLAGSYSTISVTAGPDRDFKPVIMFPSGGKVDQVALLSDKKAVLKCIFAGKPEPYVRWEKVGGDLPAGRHLFNNDPQKRTLIIDQLTLKDEGAYKCTGYSPKKQWTGGHAIVNLLVEAIPTFKTDGKPENKNATVGDDVTFSCKVDGTPTPRVEWMKNGEPITDKKKYIMNADGTSMTIKYVQKPADLMVVQCKASNKHGYELGDAYLNVLLKTVITEKPVDVTVPANVTEVMFNVAATSDASTPVAINWMFGDRPVVYREGVIEKLSNDSLWINFTGMKDEDKGNFIGTYTATAGNGYSEAVAAAQLMITDVPTPAPVVIIEKAGFALWWLVLLIALLLLLLLLLLCCCMWCQRNRGDAYPVDEKERANGNDPEKELADDGYKDYVRPEEEPVKGSRASLSASIKLDSDDEGSMNEYGDIDTGKFNEDGSFIGLYVADKKKESAPPPYRQNDTTV